MNISFYPAEEEVRGAFRTGEPIMAAVAEDGSAAYVCRVDECVYHGALLEKFGFGSSAGFFRVTVDSDAANWEFSCPPDYKSLANDRERTAAYYRDGISAIGEFMAEFGFIAGITIPKFCCKQFT